MLAGVLAVVLMAAACSSDDGGGAGARGPARGERGRSTSAGVQPDLQSRADPLPVVTPTPRLARWLGHDVIVPETVTIRTGAGVEPGTVKVVEDALRAAGAQAITPARGAPAGDDPSALTVDVGLLGGADSDAGAGAAFRAARLAVPADLPAEGYALAVFEHRGGGGTIALAGADPAGTFYAAQTLRQLVRANGVAAVGIVDHPAMRHRGTIEGFYGRPWSTEERLDQLAFYGRFKLNTYVYAPKDDPYHRDRWRDPYPADQLAGLARLVEAADANHVRFTFAVSPGVSVCYSQPADLTALIAKFDALYLQGVRSFSVALDDIDHTRWNCPGDAARYGPPSTAAAARAQVDLVNAVQHEFADRRAGTDALQMVPTEYRGMGDSDYRRALRSGLDPKVEVMWTGPFVVPPEITVADAGAAAGTFGRHVYLWDNTPVNDFPATEGRLILAPYARRQAGLSGQLTGIVLNPMNQAAASKVQLVGAADFAWNDLAYDPARAHRAAAAELAGGDPATTDALLAFFDLENLAPTSLRSGGPSQTQAPALAAQLAAFRAAWARGDRAGAVAGLRPVAARLAGAPARIRAHVVDAGFVADCGPWLDATVLWGQALQSTLDGLAARTAGDTAGATTHLDAAGALVARARAVHTIAGVTRPQGPVKVGDGVLDRFLTEARSL